MAVPAHDTRDFEFAKKFNLPIKPVIMPKDGKIDEKEMTEAYTDVNDGIAINSGFLNGLASKEAIKKAKENGHLVFINTGRTFSGIPKTITELNFDGYVCGCGTHIYFQGKKIKESVIPNDQCVETVKILRKYQVYAFYEADQGIYFDFSYPNPFLEMGKKIFGTQGKSIDEIIEDQTKTFDKCLISLKENPAADSVMEYFRQHYYCISRGDDVWEMTQKSCNKVTGIQEVWAYLGADLEDCLAVGDSENDLDMLKAVKNSIAMGNARPSILPYCSYVTADILDDGMYHALQHYDIT